VKITHEVLGGATFSTHTHRLPAIDRGRYLKVGVGSNWNEDEGRSRGLIQEGVASSHNVSLGVLPRIILEFLCAKWNILGQNCTCFDYKQTAILAQTVGHKWFIEVE